MEQAKKIIADHGSELPSLTRTMSRSNVAKGFWMVRLKFSPNFLKSMNSNHGFYLRCIFMH